MAKMGTQTTTTTMRPEWFADFGSRDHLVPAAGRVDAAQFNATDAVVVTATGNAVIGATSIAVTALSGPIPSGTMLYFGSGKYARLTAAAAAGATSIAVEALPVQVSTGNTATYAGTGKIEIPAGTYVGRTFAERDAGTLFGPAATTDDEKYLIWNDVEDAANNPEVTFVQPGSRVKENKLPGWTALSSGLKADIRAKYTTLRGAD